MDYPCIGCGCVPEDGEMRAYPKLCQNCQAIYMRVKQYLQHVTRDKKPLRGGRD